jgi:hypothetical protein
MAYSSGLIDHFRTHIADPLISSDAEELISVLRAYIK